MARRTRGPRWRVLYMLVALIVGSLALDAWLHLSPQGHELFEAAIILVGYGLIFVWVEANGQALDNQSEREETDQAPTATKPSARPTRRIRLLDEALDYPPVRHTGDGDGAGLDEPEQIWVNRG